MTEQERVRVVEYADGKPKDFRVANALLDNRPGKRSVMVVFDEPISVRPHSRLSKSEEFDLETGWRVWRQGVSDHLSDWRLHEIDAKKILATVVNK